MSKLDIVSNNGTRIKTPLEELQEKTFMVNKLIDQLNTFDRLKRRMRVVLKRAPKVLPINENEITEMREYMIEMDLAENVSYAQLVSAIVDRNDAKRKYYDGLNNNKE